MVCSKITRYFLQDHRSIWTARFSSIVLQATPLHLPEPLHNFVSDR
jgi:hypothetical protein